MTLQDWLVAYAVWAMGGYHGEPPEGHPELVPPKEWLAARRKG